MNRLAITAGTLALALLTPAVAGAQAAALERGSVRVGGSVFAGVQDRADLDTEYGASIRPDLEFFVRDGLAIGGQLGLGLQKSDQFTQTSLLVGPVATWYFVRESRTHPFVRATASYGVYRNENELDTTTGGHWGVSGAVGLLHLLTDAVGVDASLFLDRTTADVAFGGDRVTTSGGLRVGFSAFLP